MAITVLFSHSYGQVFTGPVLAVQVFYIISGFLISFVLTEARTYRTVSSFYLNRCLRLFPIYWVVALATLASLVAADVAFGVSPPVFDVFREIDGGGRLALAASNLALLGQDWIMFTGVRDGVFQFVADYRESEIPVWHGLLIPPAWTLGVELSFYLVAPFILFRPRLMVLLLAASLLLRLAIVLHGPGLDDPWTYRFFPTELALFLIGALSHRFWMPWLKRRQHLTVGKAALAVGLVALACALFSPLAEGRAGGGAILLGLVVLALPFLFQFQESFRWDRRIGELSYPIYIAHWSILFPVSYVWDRAFAVQGYKGLDETMVVLALTLAAALLLNRAVADPVERLRRRVRSGRAGTASLASA